MKSTNIEQYFKDNPPRTTAEAQAAILKLTGIKRSPTQIRVFMKRIGLRCLKVGHIPAKATTSDKTKEQEEFKKELEPRLEEAKNSKEIA